MYTGGCRDCCRSCGSFPYIYSHLSLIEILIMAEKITKRINHPIPPLYDRDSRILILGSFPSVKSREAAFFYGHPQNRFWKLMAFLLSEKYPETVDERADMMHRNRIALWDTIASCEITGSSDSSIKNVVTNDLTSILSQAPIERIYCNGAKSHEYYKKYIQDQTGIEAVRLPSTSPANASFSLEKLAAHWRQILVPLRIAPPGIGDNLVAWYDHNARILPWRSRPAPYHVWISEIMLQQTRVEVVKDYYDRWMEALPDVEAVSRVSEDTLMKLWEGLGYYNRARNIKEAAITVMERYQGRFPGEYDQLLSLKGIGEYTAGAVASIAFGKPYAAVDGNVLRVFSRILAQPEDPAKRGVKKALEKEVLRVMPKDRPGDFNQALMDLGATVCLPKGKPVCHKCPWEEICRAHSLGREEDFPVRAEKKSRKIQERAVLIIRYRDRILLHRRPAKGLLAGLWEFPGLEGKFSPDKVRQELESRDLTDFDLILLGEGKHIFSHVEWHMTGYGIRLHHLADRIKDRLARREDWILVTPEELKKKYAVPSAFAPFMNRVIAEWT